MLKIASINSRSLTRNFELLYQCVLEGLKDVSIIAIQEIWKIKIYVHLKIDGFNGVLCKKGYKF